jgi:hypothetical protein
VRSAEQQHAEQPALAAGASGVVAAQLTAPKNWGGPRFGGALF